jgi:hypothetical protein
MNRRVTVVIVGGNQIARDLAAQEVTAALRREGITIFTVRDAAGLILSWPQYARADLVVLEGGFPLVYDDREDPSSPPSPEFLEKMEVLSIQEPQLVNEWSEQTASERLMSWMRKTGVKTPVILHQPGEALDDSTLGHDVLTALSA